MTNSAVTSQPPNAAVHGRPGEGPVQRWRRLLEGRLLRQVTLPVLVGLLQLGMALVELVRTPVTPASLLWLLGSFGLGFGFGCAVALGRLVSGGPPGRGSDALAASPPSPEARICVTCGLWPVM